MILPAPDTPHAPAQAEALLDRVLTERNMGLVPDDELRSLMPRLRWRDAKGGRFTLGVNSRTWYAWDGTGWAPSNPAPTLWIDLDPEPQPSVDPSSRLEPMPAAAPPPVPVPPPLRPSAPPPLPVATPAQGAWTPTHRVPDRGMAAFSKPDGNAPAPRLDARLPVAVIERRGDWAYVECANGWKTWVDGRLLS
jgi:hypothetical protein